MNEYQRKAVLAKLIGEMEESKSWCGETHIQKTVYFLTELFPGDLNLEFILYKHGPFSFDLRDVLTEMRADDLIDWRVKHASYGASCESRPMAKELIRKFAATVGEWDGRLQFVARCVSSGTVLELERLATALFILRKEELSEGEVPKRLVELKPHVNLDDARHAVSEVLDIEREAAAIAG